jgi:hypothetical protein
MKQKSNGCAIIFTSSIIKIIIYHSAWRQEIPDENTAKKNKRSARSIVHTTTSMVTVSLFSVCTKNPSATEEPVKHNGSEPNAHTVVTTQNCVCD